MNNSNAATPAASDVKAFVPARDFDTSLDFYRALGWTLNWRDDSGLAELELANVRFYLQDYYQKDWAENFMLYIPVTDARAWWDFAREVIDSDPRFGESRVSAPKEEPYGALVTYLWDPSGVLLHLAEAR